MGFHKGDWEGRAVSGHLNQKKDLMSFQSQRCSRRKIILGVFVCVSVHCHCVVVNCHK